jgi:cell division protease FtsH
MKKDNKSGWKVLLEKKWMIFVPLLIGAILFLIVLGRPTKNPQEFLSLSRIAQGISQGEIEKIEDSPTTGELHVYFQDGTMEKAMRDPDAPLLEQLSLLGVDRERLSGIQYSILKQTAANGNVLGFVFTLGLVGVVIAYSLRTTQTDRIGKRKFEETCIPDVRFDQVAGVEDNLQELRDIVTFLKEGNRYAAMGAKMPRGVLMVGDPGTGKTMIAKAVAGEAGVPFFATSGSEFTEVFVGVGASRIRSLFKKARKKAPCIVFIDEIDAVGRSRHRSESGGEMEQDQTLNQLLVEMDGFDSSEGIIVLAATNRLDVLDSALTRPGRFDRRVFINRPDVKGREAILTVHVRGKKLSPDVMLSNVAKATPGLVGADLANIVNEAAITAVRSGRPNITMQDFDEAVEKQIAGGVARKNQVMSEDERRIVAYHEAGHAVVIHAIEHSDPVYKITIIPRGLAGGYTLALPENDRMLMSRCKMLARITGLMGGRAAEEIFFQDITNGASNDLDVSTQLAEEMVTRLGMGTRTGLRVFPNQHGRTSFIAYQGSQKTIENIDEAVNQILESCYADARRIILEKQETVKRIADTLLEVETLDREQFVKLMAAP